jgi:hypothetical protein
MQTRRKGHAAKPACIPASVVGNRTGVVCRSTREPDWVCTQLERCAERADILVRSSEAYPLCVSMWRSPAETHIYQPPPRVCGSRRRRV